MTTACVMYLREFCPGPAIETEHACRVSTKAVAAGHVNAIVDGGGRRVVETDRQAWTRAPCGAIEYPYGLQAVAGGIEAAHHIQLPAYRGRRRFLERHGQRRLHTLARRRCRRCGGGFDHGRGTRRGWRWRRRRGMQRPRAGRDQKRQEDHAFHHATMIE